MLARYEYKVVPAPRSPKKVRGVKGDEARFAFALEETINSAAMDGWEYVRSETLPCEHRGWFSRKTEDQALLVFRRGKGEDVAAVAGARVPAEPRLAAERGVQRRANFTSLRAAPADRNEDA